MVATQSAIKRLFNLSKKEMSPKTNLSICLSNLFMCSLDLNLDLSQLSQLCDMWLQYFWLFWIKMVHECIFAVLACIGLPGCTAVLPALMFFLCVFRSDVRLRHPVDPNISLFSFVKLFLVCFQLISRPTSFQKVQEVIVLIPKNYSFYLPPVPRTELGEKGM